MITDMGDDKRTGEGRTLVFVHIDMILIVLLCLFYFLSLVQNLKMSSMICKK